MAPTVLITGASQGSGKATALRFAREGYDVVLAARQAERLEMVAQAVETLGRKALAIPTDVSDPDQVQILVGRALDVYVQIDVLVNNAGICLSGPIDQTSLNDWQRIMAINFFGYVHTIAALLPHFLARGAGTIVNVGSFGGKMPLPHMSAYCASKYAVVGLTESMRLELAPRGIHVAIVHPGVVNSSFMERAIFVGKDESHIEARRRQMRQSLQSAWVSQPEDIADAIWRAVRDRRSEIIVGPALLATEAYRLFPDLVKGVMGWAQ